jgi:uncharacterized ion transporter superfamily protein YfcC
MTHILLAFPKALVEVAGIIFYIFIIGDTFGVLNRTSSIQGGIQTLVKRIGGRQALIVPVLTLVFAVEPPLSVVQSRALAPVLILVVSVFRHPWTALEEAHGFDAEGVTGASRILADAFKPERIYSGIRPEVE